MRKLSLILVVLLLVSGSFAQDSSLFDLSSYGVRIEPDKRLIAVLATLELAGMETELAAEGRSFRQQILAGAKDIDPNLKQKIKIFVDQYRKRHPNQKPDEVAAPFVSMAFC